MASRSCFLSLKKPRVQDLQRTKGEVDWWIVETFSSHLHFQKEVSRIHRSQLIKYLLKVISRQLIACMNVSLCFEKSSLFLFIYPSIGIWHQEQAEVLSQHSSLKKVKNCPQRKLQQAHSQIIVEHHFKLHTQAQFRICPNASTSFVCFFKTLL